MVMKISKPENKNVERILLDEGSYPARIYSVIDLGTHKETWQGVDKMNRKIKLSFEIPSETITYEKDGKEVTAPIALHRTFNASTFEKASIYPFLKSAVGNVPDTMEMMDLLGKEMLITVSQYQGKDGNTYNGVENASPLPKGMTVEQSPNELRKFDLDNFDQKEYDALFEWEKEKVDVSLERTQNTPKVGNSDMDYPEEDISPDSIPFN